MSDLSEVAAMIARLEAAGMTRREIAQGANVGASAITRIMLGDAKSPSFRLITSIKQYYRQHFPDADAPPSRHAPRCAPRAGR